MTARAILAGLALLAATPAAAQTQTQTLAPAPAFRLGASAITDFAVPVQTFMERRYSGVLRQQYDFSCGSAALATLLRYHYRLAVDEQRAFKGMWARGDRAQIQRLGFSLLDMKRWLASAGIEADGYQVTLDQIAQTGLPGIALISVANYKHFVVIKGISQHAVLVGDPSTGLHQMDRASFQQAWNGVYFVLNGELEQGRRHFNRMGQWAAWSGAPTTGLFTQPLSQQALALAAPFFRDF